MKQPVKTLEIKESFAGAFFVKCAGQTIGGFHKKEHAELFLQAASEMEQVLKDAFDCGWNASHDCATSFDKENALNNFMAQNEIKKFIQFT